MPSINELQNELRAILERKYDRKEWFKVLRKCFNVTTLHHKPVDITDRIKSNQYKATAKELGNFTTPDGYLVGIYEVEVPEKALIHRNRKGLRDLLSQVYSTDVDAALLVFIQGSKWRFTYVSEITVRNPVTRKREKKITDPKRFTYLLGEGERAKTASERFAVIRDKESVAGTGVTLNTLEEAFSVEKMSKAFFHQYRRHYGVFTAYLTGEDENGKKVGKASPYLESTFNGIAKEARDFVKKMMGRIVFLYFLEKKGWLGVPHDKKWGEGDEHFLSNLFKHCRNKSRFYSQVLVPLFFKTLNVERKEDIFIIDEKLFTEPGYGKLRIPYLNGGLFEEDEEKKQQLDFPEEYFEKLFTFFDQYNFTVYEDSPDEHTVAVDPEMLGHIFENLLEDNKQNGTFYTPKEVVHYMCCQSLIKYLYGRLNPDEKKEYVERDKIERFVLNHETAGIIQYDEQILQALKEVKICDPAIGSGAFPMGLLMEIFHLVEILYEDSQDVTIRVLKLKDKPWEENKAAVKLNIIQNCIYGVDLERGAVDIARLRFGLSLVVDEEKPTPLPNLDYKIVVGDSLLSRFEGEVINIDWDIKTKNASAVKHIIADQQVKFKQLEKLQHSYFAALGEKDKERLQKEIKDLKIDILINQLELSKIQFAENHKPQPVLEGFKSEKDEQEEQAYKSKLVSLNKAINTLKQLKANKNSDLDFFDWKLNFPEVLNKSLSKENSGFDIIIGNPPYVEVSAAYRNMYFQSYAVKNCKELYAYFYEKCLNELIRKKGIFCFITASLFVKGVKFAPLRTLLETKLENVQVRMEGDNVFEDVQMPTCTVIGTRGDANGWKFEDFIENFSLLRKISNQPETISSLFDVNRGLEIGRDKTSYEKGVKIITGSDVKILSVKSISYTTKDIVKEYAKDKYYFSGPRILIRETGSTLTAVYLEDFIWHNRSLYALKMKQEKKQYDIKAVLAIISSKLIQFFYQTKFKSETNIFPKIRIVQVKQIPIPDSAKVAKLSKLSAQLVAAGGNENVALRKEIDLAVYKLYNLTWEEACIVEGNDSWTSQEYYEKYEVK